jgi:DNA-binding GntR family transcriptional regulator
MSPAYAGEFGVSRTPVREALRRLGGTELVEMTPRKGVIVARIDVEQLTDMYEALAEFEGLCARLSAVRMTALEKKRLELLNGGREARLATGDRDDLAAINSEFHEAIYQGSHSPSIASVTRNFRQRLASFRVLQFVPGQTEHSFRGHDEIVRAILASDAEGACRAMRDHVTSVGLQAIENFSNHRFAPAAETATLGERLFG